MKRMDESDLHQSKGTISLRLMLEKDVNVLRSFSKESPLPDNQTIHEIRKSLKSISAIFLLYKYQFNGLEYFRLKCLIRSISKRYGALRESYVHLQTYKNIEERLHLPDNSDQEDLRNRLELKYKQTAEESETGESPRRQMNEELIRLTNAIVDLEFNAEYRHLRKRIKRNDKKTRKLFDRLKLSSKHEEFHQFRKSAKRLYFQQAALKRMGFPKIVKHPKLLFKITEYLGREHDLQLFSEYLNVYFVGLTPATKPFFRFQIKRLRKKILTQYPQRIN